MGGFIFKMMGLINDDAVILWQQAANLEILEQQGMVGDDDACLLTLTLAVEVTTFIIEWAASAKAGIRCAGNILPVLNFGLVKVEVFTVAAVVLSVPKHQGGGKNALTL